MPDCGDGALDAYTQRLTGIVQGGQPHVVPTMTFLGADEESKGAEVEATLRQIEQRGALARHGACKAAEAVSWPLETLWQVHMLQVPKNRNGKLQSA